MCRVLSVKPSSYYDWLGRDLSEQQIHRNQSELLVRAAHSETKERYGADRLHAHLSEQGHNISLYMVRSIKKNMVSNAVATNALKLPPTPITTSWFIQTYWISSLMPSVLMNLGSVTLLISGHMRAGCT